MQWFIADLWRAIQARTTARPAMRWRPMRTRCCNSRSRARAERPADPQARAVLNREPLAEYSYNRIMRSKRVQAIPDGRSPTMAAPAPGGCSSCARASRLDNGVPGIYTWAGYHNVFLPLLPTVTRIFAEDSWVLGRPKRDVSGTLEGHHQAPPRRDGPLSRRLCAAWDRLLPTSRSSRSATCNRPWTSLACCQPRVAAARPADRRRRADPAEPRRCDRPGAGRGAGQGRQGRRARHELRGVRGAQRPVAEAERVASILSEAFGNDAVGQADRSGDAGR